MSLPPAGESTTSNDDRTTTPHGRQRHMTENVHETGPSADETAQDAPRVPPTAPPAPGMAYDEGPVTPTEAVTPSAGPVVAGDTAGPVPAPVVEEWNPLRRSEPVTRELKSSGGAASIICQRWSGRERIAYEDAITQRMLVAKINGKVDDDGEDEETVAIGTMRLFALSMTLKGATGFPPHPEGRAWFEGGREYAETDYLLINDPDTLEEIREIAFDVQPLPRMGGGEGETKPKGSGDASDPSPTPSTPPVETPQLG